MNPARRALRYTVRLIKYTACAHLFFEYLFDIRATSGPSMLPTFDIRNDWVILSKRHVRGRGVEVGDVVSFWIPMHPGKGGIKRVIGMPGDFVLTGTPGGGSDEMIQVRLCRWTLLLVCGREKKKKKKRSLANLNIHRCLKDIVGWLEIIWAGREILVSLAPFPLL